MGIVERAGHDLPTEEDAKDGPCPERPFSYGN